MNTEKNYQDILSEALGHINVPGTGEDNERRKGIGKAVSALAMVIGDFSYKFDSFNKKIDDFNSSTNSYIKANNKSGNAMIALTVGLVLFAAAQVFVSWLSYKSEQEIKSIRQSCYQSALNTSDINLNYQNCLHSKGLSE